MSGQFDFSGDPQQIISDLSAAHIRDASSVAALDAVQTKYGQRGKTVEITGLNDGSARLHGKLSVDLLAILIDQRAVAQEGQPADTACSIRCRARR